MGKTAIGWTDETWNPTTGCSVVSPGCDHCYAHELSILKGWSKKPWTARNAAENVVLHPDRLEHPLHWRKPRMVFVDSMSDLFHKNIPPAFRATVYATMALCGAYKKGHVFQVLTKRVQEARAFLASPDVEWAAHLANMAEVMYGDEDASHVENSINGVLGEGHNVGWPLNNVWLGVSVEDQRRADERIPVLLETPAAVRWLSCEPLLGPIDITLWLGNGIDWVVVGGESGREHRVMDPAWLESIVDQCQANATPVFVKQDSGSRQGKQGRIPDELWALKEFPRPKK